MGLFSKPKKSIPTIETDQFEPVLRCSICPGEQVLCLRDRKDDSLHELMLIRTFGDLKEVCDANHIDPASIRKIY